MIIKDISSEISFSNNFLKKYNFVCEVVNIEIILSDKYEDVIRLDENDKPNSRFKIPAIYKKINDVSIKDTIFVEMSLMKRNRFNCWSEYENIPEVRNLTKFIVMSVDSKCLVKLKLAL